MRVWWALLFVAVGLLFFSPKASPGTLQKADWIVVLGAAQYNGEPSAIFRNRLEAALHLYRQGYAPRIAVTGGRAPGDRYSEGGVGCSYLETRGFRPRPSTASRKAGAPLKTSPTLPRWSANPRSLSSPTSHTYPAPSSWLNSSAFRPQGLPYTETLRNPTGIGKACWPS